MTMRRLIQNGAVLTHAIVDLAVIIAMGVAAETVIAYDTIKERKTHDHHRTKH